MSFYNSFNLFISQAPQKRKPKIREKPIQLIETFFWKLNRRE